MENIRYSTRRLAVLGLMLAMITALSAMEHMLPPLPFLPPGVRLGLSNIITMYTLFFLGKKSALLLVVLKSGFVLLMRGATASFLSLCGGLLSVLIIMLLAALFHERISWLMLSIFGAVFHNLGQIIAASCLLGSNLVFWYMPVLLVSGLVMGCATGILLRVVMPLFDRLLNRIGTHNNAKGSG